MTQAARQKPGPKPRFTQQDLVDAALAIVDTDGFRALSLRAVARELGVTSMAIYTYVKSREELYGLVVDRLITAKLDEFVWPEDWPDALQLFAARLGDLINEHPALIEAFAHGQMRTAVAASVANDMLERLLAGGLPLRRAGVAYAAMHALVLGHAVLRQASKTAGHERHTPMQEVSAQNPALARYVAAEGQIADVGLHELLALLVAGVEAGTAVSPSPSGPRTRPSPAR